MSGQHSICFVSDLEHRAPPCIRVKWSKSFSVAITFDVLSRLLGRMPKMLAHDIHACGIDYNLQSRTAQLHVDTIYVQQSLCGLG